MTIRHLKIKERGSSKKSIEMLEEQMKSELFSSIKGSALVRANQIGDLNSNSQGSGCTQSLRCSQDLFITCFISRRGSELASI